MVWTVALLSDGQRTSEERLRLAKPVGCLQQSGEVVEACGDVGVVWAVAFFVDGQGAPEERARLGRPVGFPQEGGRVGEPSGAARARRDWPHSAYAPTRV